MNNAALVPTLNTVEPIPHPQEDRLDEAWVRLSGHQVEIRVIPLGRLEEQNRPFHARAIPTAMYAGVLPEGFATLLRGIQGIPFGLTKREHAFATCAGALFSIIAFMVSIP